MCPCSASSRPPPSSPPLTLCAAFYLQDVPLQRLLAPATELPCWLVAAVRGAYGACRTLVLHPRATPPRSRLAARPKTRSCLALWSHLAAPKARGMRPPGGGDGDAGGREKARGGWEGRGRVWLVGSTFFSLLLIFLSSPSAEPVTRRHVAQPLKGK
jgi:hypothetical protein